MYRVVKCPHCAFFQVTGDSKSLKCQRCSKSKVISYLKIYYQSEDSMAAGKALAKLKEEEHKSKSRSDDFESVI